MTELEDDISADLEDEDPAEDDYPAENDLEEEPSLGSLGMGEWSDQTKWAAGNRTDLEDAASAIWKACSSRLARKAGNWMGMSDATDPNTMGTPAAQVGSLALRLQAAI
ncbi:hypothetical protein [Bradyrhizobium sp. 76]|uniref:hypothetical protein n=1 Tax=Bradyrhizobium sp. 76 TaxID=2782680 RepID=UPI001FFA339F|nr:hypothetical protein [Bradyrhizobium sp. 76]MCK1406804.1 hypothetical protein [Bradyrhizobium sp. 76]